MKKFLGFLLIIGVLTLTACGGGGGGDGPDENSAPVANAGLDQNISTGSTVTLTGGGFDANGDLLNYSWSFTSKPAGSSATLSNLTVSNPTFSADLDGTYILSLVVNDGTETSLSDSVTITAATSNSAPVAAAGNDQSVVVGTLVNLDGSASSDANSDLLTYTWEITSKPAGSSSNLSSTTVVSPTFTADVAGAYVLNLVVNDGKVNSSVASVTITATVANAAPVANAGIAKNVITGVVVMLDGSASSDANGDLLTYSWAFTSKPLGSNAALSNATVAKPTFTADVAGAYVLNLVVNDGLVNSAAVTTTVTASVANAAPVANAGTAQSVVVGDLVTLDGSASSDANGDLLTYLWVFTSIPAGSNAALLSSTAAKPTFTADVAGAYVLNLVVNDGLVNSAAVTTTVTASVANAAPVANAGSDKIVVIGDSLYLDSSLSSDPNGDTLSYRWDFISTPEGSYFANLSSTEENPSFIPDLPGRYSLRLTVYDSQLSTTSNVTITVANSIISSNLRIFTNDALSMENLSLCNFYSTIDIMGYKWTFTDCRIFGDAGNKLTYEIRNNTSNTYNIEYINFYSSAFNFDTFYNITLQPYSTYKTDIILKASGEVTHAKVTTRITGLNDLITNFDINTVLH